MLEIKVDLIPFGIESNKKTLGSITIINNGTGTSIKGNYSYQIQQNKIGKNKVKIIEGVLLNYSRTKGSVFGLIREILNKENIK